MYPRKERQALMMALNNLLASPSFEAWREGEPMDVERLLRAADGRPRLSIVYTAHLADEERLFVTALLLDKVKTWMRRQGGTGDLRALVYMDEIFGYFPPHPANPPPDEPPRRRNAGDRHVAGSTPPQTPSRPPGSDSISDRLRILLLMRPRRASAPRVR